MLFGVVERYAMFGEERVHLHTGSIAENSLDFALEHPARLVGFDEESFERDAGGILAGGGECCGVGVRDVDGHLHGFGVVPGGLEVSWRKAI